MRRNRDDDGFALNVMQSVFHWMPPGRVVTMSDLIRLNPQYTAASVKGAIYRLRKLGVVQCMNPQQGVYRRVKNATLPLDMRGHAERPTPRTKAFGAPPR